jgi:asparagine synthase (glutamine-hydrolysing)
MCGFGGVVLAGGRTVKRDVLQRLGDAMAHRGPDGEGFYAKHHVGLVHRRLSIIDLAGGAQPIAAAEGDMQIVCNGEIYNYRPLQDVLEKQGVRLTTRSDSEVPMHLYRRHGLDFVTHLDGMYALAIYDGRSGDVILARDPVGIKPLYYCQIDAGIAFASEAGALVRAGWCASEVNPAAWPSFFNRQFVGGQHTLFKNIHRVLPGEVLVLRDGKIAERKHYPLELNPPHRLSEADALAQLDAVMTKSVTTHLQSEVPYGAFLSGGVDSSTVVSLMSEVDANTVRTYTIGFDSTTVSDERAQAYRLAAALKTDHATVGFTEDDFWAYLPIMCTVMDDLVADYAALPTLKLAARAHEDVKVILSGEGGDEIFAGYSRYRRGGWLDTLRGRTFGGRGDAADYATLFRDDYVAHWRGKDRQTLFPDAGFTRLQHYQACDMADWLPDDLLTKVDRCLMAYGIEGRVPLLDRHVISFAFSLPDTLKVQGRQGKYLLKKWLDKRHPMLGVWDKKRGFTVPVQAWLEGRRRRIATYLLEHPGIAQALNTDDLKNWLAHPLDKKGAKLLFTILCYALWHDIYILGRPLPERLLASAQRAG